MSQPVKKDLIIRQGGTFTRSFTWYGAGHNFRQIESITPGAPTVLTVTGHGMSATSETPVIIKNVKGAPDLNTDTCKATAATYVTDDTFSVKVDTTERDPRLGVVEYFTNSDLSTYTARMQIRATQSDDTVIHELTTVNGGITLSAEGQISMFISDTDTAAFDFTNAVYDLELIDGSGNVTPILEGKVTLSLEVTR